MKSPVTVPLAFLMYLTLPGGTPASRAVANATSSERTVSAVTPTLIGGSVTPPPSSLGLHGYVVSLASPEGTP